MKKLIYLVAIFAASLTVSCGGNTSDNAAADASAAADSIAKVQADSVAAVEADSIAKADSVAKADSIQKAQKASAAGAGIDKKLKKFSGYVSDIRDMCYDGNQFMPGTALHDLLPPAQKLDRELKGMKDDMTPEQLSKYQKLRNSIKQALDM